MSPEQLEGKETDARSDLWAFGCVLYEMATAKRAFDGKSQASLIGAIMHAEPAPISTVTPVSPPALDRLVSAMLAKDPADRVQSARREAAIAVDGGRRLEHGRRRDASGAASRRDVETSCRGRWPASRSAAAAIGWQSTRRTV
jgi:serine/threonine-protein kinase